jgi:hypothetical protein
MSCPFQFYNPATNHDDVIDWLEENYKFKFEFNCKSSIHTWLWENFGDTIFAMESNEDGYCRVINPYAKWEVMDGHLYIKDVDDALIFKLKWIEQ